MKRRNFLASSAAGITLGAMGRQRVWGEDDRAVRLAVIGVANRGSANIAGVENQDIVAICDVDAKNLADAQKRFPKAEAFRDYREMLAQIDPVDGVVISTPDHHHAVAAMRAMDRGFHVYCEKPLSHTVAEARALTIAAKKRGLVTQMGTQIHAQENYRRVVEKIRAGYIGDVSEVHVWVGKGWGATEMPKPGGTCPERLDWDLWLGSAPQRDYTAGLHPANWRRYRDFGTGTLGDMGCHYMDLPFWALGLKYPEKITADGTERHPECCPLGLKVRYEFAASDHHGDLDFYWYDGNLCPKELHGVKVPPSGVLFVGDRGKLVSTYGNHSLHDHQAGKPSEIQTIAPSIGHHAEWIAAIKNNDPTSPLCRFDYSGPLTETVLLGTVAHQVGRPIKWNGLAAKVVGDDEAQGLISKPYRDGWQLHGQLSAAKS